MRILLDGKVATRLLTDARNAIVDILAAIDGEEGFDLATEKHRLWNVFNDITAYIDSSDDKN